MSIRVMVVDDHRIVREGLLSLLAKEEDLRIVGEAETGREALKVAKDVSPNVVIMDITMPDMNGVEATRQLCKVDPHVRVLALSMKTDHRLVGDVLRAGARGFLVKDCAFEELALAIRTIHAGNPYLSPTIQNVLVDEFVKGISRGDDISAMTVLSSRERQVLQLIAEGASTKHIASVLDLSPKTVESHRANIMSKVGLNNVAQLTKYAIREGLTALDI